MKPARIALVLGWMLATPALGSTLLVPEDFPTIQEALDIASPGDVVSVAPGIYHEKVQFACHGVVLESRTPHAATIDGGGEGHVVVCNPYSATVEGFVIKGSGNGYYAGVFTSQASQVIRNNIITDNNGHGVVVSSGSVARIERNVIVDNGLWHAGIKCMTGASATVVSNYIAGNRFGVHCATTGEVVIVNNTIVNHIKWSIYFGETRATIANNILAGAEIGILFAGPYDPDLNGFVAEYVWISHNDMWQNSMYDYYAELITFMLPDIWYTNVGPFTPFPGTGEISADPLLGGPGGYQLQLGSPCIDAGEPGYEFECGALDLDGHARFLCTHVDMGAAEFGIGDHDCNGDIDLSDYRQLATCMTGPDAGPVLESCAAVDFDGDCDVDLTDFLSFGLAFTGAAP